MGIKKFFVPSRTDGEKFLLTMQKQKIIVHAFYIALLIALLSAFVKVFAFKANPIDIISEELIFFIPLLYIAVRQVKSGLETAKKVSPANSFPMLLLLALIAGICSFIMSFGAVFAYSRFMQASLDIVNSVIICGIAGVLTAVLFYYVFWLVIHKDNGSAKAQKPDNTSGKKG